MFNKLKNVYQNSQIVYHPSEIARPHQYLWLYDAEQKGWLVIPIKDVSNKEIQLLENLFERHEPSIAHIYAESWYHFLFSNGEVPKKVHPGRQRIIQFTCDDTTWEKCDLELALKGFFARDTILFWENTKKGVLIEEETDAVSTEDLYSIIQTFTGDFFMTPSFYVGKFFTPSQETKHQFLQEKQFFHLGLELLPNEHVFTFEKVLPSALALQMPTQLRKAISINLFPSFKDEPDLLQTLKVYLESNLNASLTAKKLFIHRNTLQYRLDKFVEKTGVQLKDFNSAFTIYLACLLYQHDRQ
ncbi:PucR family transcriptional regulator [Bacillus sp. FJAT-42315]|uniref:PucR family transcriptional regulator n=1 Tax=Bacillus sp. FJAT-42315 TaxID=2014077 RepID=UPI000C23157D|nr:helix-turn-helix domain-containing protein [Bacillus sp. FJAT-42315]